MNKKHLAQQLYMQGHITQKEIAEKVGISERTAWAWIHNYSWDKLRLAAYQAPVTIADNLCSQIVELQNAIARKEPGCRYPDAQEAEIMRKLITMLDKMKKTPSLSQNMQVLETFRNYVRPLDKDLARQLAIHTTGFLEGKSVNGYAPYQAEYGVEQVSPISPCYEESEEEPADPDTCPDISTCLHEGNCNYPKCRPDRHIDPATRHPVSPVLYNATVIEQPGPSAVADCANKIEPHILPQQTGESGSNPAIPQYKQAENRNEKQIVTESFCLTAAPSKPLGQGNPPPEKNKKIFRNYLVKK